MSITGVPEQPNGPFIPLLESPAVEGLSLQGHAISDQYTLQLSNDDTYTPPPEVMKADMGAGIMLLIAASSVTSFALGFKYLIRRLNIHDGKGDRWLSDNDVADQLKKNYVADGHVFDDVIRNLELTDGNSARSDELIAVSNEDGNALFLPLKDDEQYLFPFLAVMAIHEWGELSEVQRKKLYGQKHAGLEGKLPERFLKAFFKREMADDSKLMEHRQLAPVFLHLWEIKDRSLWGQNDNRVYPYDKAMSYARHLLEMWKSSNENVRTAFGRRDPMLPASFLAFIEPIAYLYLNDFAQRGQKLVDDWNPLTDVGKRQYWLKDVEFMDSPALPPGIATSFVREWNARHPVQSKRNEGDDGDDGGGTVGSGRGTRPPLRLVPPRTGGVASRIAEVRQRAVTIDRFETADETRSGAFAPSGFFRTALAGVRNFFSPQIQMPSPVLVPVNTMPLGTFNPMLTVF